MAYIKLLANELQFNDFPQTIWIWGGHHFSTQFNTNTISFKNAHQQNFRCQINHMRIWFRKKKYCKEKLKLVGICQPAHQWAQISDLQHTPFAHPCSLYARLNFNFIWSKLIIHTRIHSIKIDRLWSSSWTGSGYPGQTWEPAFSINRFALQNALITLK